MKAVEVAAVAGLMLLGCQSNSGSTPPPMQAQPSTATRPDVDHAFEVIAREFESWGRADYVEEPFAGVSVIARGPHAGNSDLARKLVQAGNYFKAVPSSRADARSPHSARLFYLFVKDRVAYMAPTSVPQPIGQAVVMETFIPVPGDLGERIQALREFPSKRAPGTHIWQLPPGTPAGLFLIVKGDESDPSTDNGWTYAELSPDGDEVRQSGRLATCMTCHASAPYDRLFGLPE
jgi:hypothetical protein